MERQFQINWPAIIEEAKLRRKAQRLTQEKLALLAGVSVPTVSHFENGEKDLQLSTITKILTVLGMMDRREIVFQDPKYVFNRDVVLFSGRAGDKKIDCAISCEALEDHFDAEGKDFLKVFLTHRVRIEHEARRKYLANALEPDGSILIRTSDIG